MKLTVKRDELRSRLSMIQNIVEKNFTMPLLSHFLLNAKKDSSAITATDLNVSMRGPLDAAVDEAGDLCIPARKLLEIVKEAEDDITMQSAESGWLSVFSGNSTFRLACLPSEDFPAWKNIDGESSLTFKNEELAEMIEKTIFSSAESDSRYTLNGLLFHMKPDKKLITVVATDGHRMALINKGFDISEGDERMVIVPRKAASELRKFLAGEGTVSCTIGNQHILFTVGGMDFMARLVEGTYPNYESVIPNNNDKVVHLETDPFTKAIKKASIMSKENSNTVLLKVEPKTMTVSSSNPGLGEARDVVDIEYSDDPITIGFNSRYLIDAVSAFKKDKVTLSFANEVSPVILTNNGSQDHICILMPMKLL
jgi:DNA polymerase III subunit beta